MAARTEIQFDLAAKIANLGDDTFINAQEVAAITGFTVSSIRARKVRTLPAPDLRVGRLRWRLGDLREWIRGGSTVEGINLARPGAKRRHATRP